jgi:hypothetical protein
MLGRALECLNEYIFGLATMVERAAFHAATKKIKYVYERSHELMIFKRQIINYENIRRRRKPHISGDAVWSVSGNTHQTVNLHTYSSYICQGSVCVG